MVDYMPSSFPHVTKTMRPWSSSEESDQLHILAHACQLECPPLARMEYIFSVSSNVHDGVRSVSHDHPNKLEDEIMYCIKQRLFI